MFPIFFTGVWESGSEDESDERKNSRARWTTTTRHMHPAAVELLKQVQPEDRTDWLPGEVPALTRLNRLANQDKHRELVVVGGAATGLEVIGHDADGNRFSTRVREWTESRAVGQGAMLTLPPEATAVEVTGGAAVLLMFDKEGGVPIPDGLRDPLLSGSRRVADALRPFVL